MKHYYLEVLEPLDWYRVTGKKQWFTEYCKREFRSLVNDERIGPPLRGMYRIVDERGKPCFTYDRRSRDGRYLWTRSAR